MVDDRLIEIGRPSPRFMRKYGLSWFSEGDNEDYFAPELFSITEAQIEHFRAQAASLYELAIRAARHVSEQQLWTAAGIPDNAIELVEHSLRTETGLHLAGRFDFAGGLGRAPLKLLEFNADTFSLAPETATVTNRTGKRVPDTLARRIATSDTPPIRAAWGSTRPSEIPSRVRRAPSISESPGTENPNSFGSWPRITTSAIPLR